MEVVREASRKVSIFTHDLEPGIYDDPEFLEIVKRLVLSQTYARIRVLIANPARAVKNGNNFVHLGRRLNTYIEFRHVREDLRTHAESWSIVCRPIVGKASRTPTSRPLPSSTARCSMKSGWPAKSKRSFGSSEYKTPCGSPPGGQ